MMNFIKDLARKLVRNWHDVIIVLIILIALFVLPFVKVIINNNGALYLAAAKNLYSGQEMGMLGAVSRGPVFPAMLALSFLVLGFSVGAAAIVVKIFFALGVVMVFTCGRLWYNRVVGVVAAALILSSEEIHTLSRYIDTDIVLPFFILCFLFIYSKSVKSDRLLLSVLAGIILATTFLMKETSILLAALPIFPLIVLKRRQWLSHLKRSFFFYLALVLSILPWAAYVYFFSQTSNSVLGVGSSAVQGTVFGEAGFSSPMALWSYLFTVGLPGALYTFYKAKLAIVAIPIAPILVLSWIFIAIRGVYRKRLEDILLCGAVICFLPVMLLSGIMEIRLGQTTIVYFLSYLATGAALFGIIAFLVLKYRLNRTRSLPTVVVLVFLIISGTLISLQVKEIDNDRIRILFKSYLSKAKLEAVGRYTIEQQEAAFWLKKNIKDIDIVFADGYTNEGLNFFDAASYPIQNIDFAERAVVPSNEASNVDTPHSDIPIFFLTYVKFRTLGLKNRLILYIYEDTIIERIERRKVDYLVFSHRNFFLYKYFDRVPWARKMFENKSAVIYNIDRTKMKPADKYELCVNDWLSGDLEWLSKELPKDYAEVVELIEKIGLDIDSTKQCRCTIPRGQSY